MTKAISSFPDVKNLRHAVPIVITMCAALLLADDFVSTPISQSKVN